MEKFTIKDPRYIYSFGHEGHAALNGTTKGNRPRYLKILSYLLMQPAKGFTKKELMKEAGYRMKGNELFGALRNNDILVYNKNTQKWNAGPNLIPYLKEYAPEVISDILFAAYKISQDKYSKK